MSKKKPVLTARGKWEATLRNIRALKNRLTKLEARVEALENPAPIPPPPPVV